MFPSSLHLESMLSCCLVFISKGFVTSTTLKHATFWMLISLGSGLQAIRFPLQLPLGDPQWIIAPKLWTASRHSGDPCVHRASHLSIGLTRLSEVRWPQLWIFPGSCQRPPCLAVLHTVPAYSHHLPLLKLFSHPGSPSFFPQFPNPAFGYSTKLIYFSL